MPLLWLYGAFVTSHNYTLCRALVGITYIMRSLRFKSHGIKKDCGGVPPAGEGPLIFAQWDLIWQHLLFYSMPQVYRFLSCFMQRLLSGRQGGGSCGGCNPPQVAERRERVCYCPWEIDDATCLLSLLTFQ